MKWVRSWPEEHCVKMRISDDGPSTPPALSGTIRARREEHLCRVITEEDQLVLKGTHTHHIPITFFTSVEKEERLESWRFVDAYAFLARVDPYERFPTITAQMANAVKNVL